MEVIIYHEKYNREEALDNFIDVLYSNQMKYLASDLLKEGFSPSDIRSAVQRAISVGKSSDLDLRQHFSPIYTQSADQVIRDCKLSKLGYALVLLNAPAENPLVGNWQLKILKKYFEG